MNNLLSSVTESEFLGPGTDLVISLLGVLLMSIAINAKIHENEQEYLVKIKSQQKEVIESIADKFRINNSNELQIDTIDNNLFGIKTDNTSTQDVLIHNDITLQRISFGAQILFDKKKAILKDRGATTLAKIGAAIRPKLGYIEEIIIQGHTDNGGEDYYNLNLGSERAIAVFKYLHQEANINPSKHLMSISSFGEFKPVQRKEKNTNWTINKTKSANATERLKTQNRRIEIVLNYREQIPD